MYPVQSFRLFIGILFDERTIQALVEQQRAVMQLSRSGNFTYKNNLHLTLEFIGNCSLEDIKSLISIIETIQIPPFSLTFTHVGKFSRNNSDIWWVGIEQSKNLKILYRSLHEQLLENNFHVDNRTYAPHITLGRNIKIDKTKEYNKLTTLKHPWSTTVEAIHLMESTHVGGKLTYLSIHEHPLLCTRYRKMRILREKPRS